MGWSLCHFGTATSVSNDSGSVYTVTVDTALSTSKSRLEVEVGDEWNGLNDGKNGAGIEGSMGHAESVQEVGIGGRCCC